MSLTPGRCIAPTCQRTVPEGRRICRSCWAHIPIEMVLAMHDHADAYQRAPDLQAFIAWSWEALEWCAAWEASRRRKVRQDNRDPDLPGARRWVIGPDGGLFLEVIQ